MKSNNLILKLILFFTFVTSGWAYSLSEGNYKTYTVSKLANYTYTYKLDVIDGDCDFYGHHSGSPTKDNYYRKSQNPSGQDEAFSFDSTADSDFYLSIYAYSDCSYNTPTFSKVAVVTKPSLSGGVYLQDITGGIKASWNSATGTVDYYKLYRSTSNGSLGSQVYQGSSTYYNNTGLSDGVTYYYTAIAYNSAGSSSSRQDHKEYIAPVDMTEAEVFRQEFIHYDPRVATILKSVNKNAPVSRAEAVIMMEKFLSNKSTAFKNYDMSEYYLTFADADVNADYHSSLLKLSYYEGDNDNITPISKENSLFRPLDKVSRQEFIAIVVQGLDLAILDNRDYLSEFKDTNDLANVAPWAWKYFNTAVEKGLMNGNRIDINNPLLEATANLSVFEAMVILKNANNILAGNFLHTEAKFQSPDSLDVSKLLFNQIGYEYMPRYYENSANPIDITSITESTASADFCGKDNSIVLTANTTTDAAQASKVSEYYWWNTNAGYFREYNGSSNFKKVCFYPATVEPVNGYKIVVNGGDNIGYVDSLTYTSLNAAVIHANDSDSDKVSFVNNLSFTNESYMRANSAYSVTINGSFSKAGTEVGLENITISLIDGANKSILFKGQAINSKATFIVPDISTLYGKDISLEITVNTQNAKVTRTLSTVRYLPIFSVKGKVYNTSETDKATYVTIGSTKVYLDENGEFYHILDFNSEASSLSVAVESSTKNSFETLDVNLTYENSQRFLVFVGENTILDSDGDGVIDTEDDLPYDATETIDSDNDGIGNNADLDDDNDGITDSNELKYGLNPLDSTDALKDADNDGVNNYDEIVSGTNPNSATSYTSTLDLETGWNMVSLPMQVSLNINELNDPSIKIIRSFQKGSWYIWTDNNQASTDKPLHILENGYGYWIKTISPTSISLSGEEVSGSISIISDGKWHMAGSMKIDNTYTFFANNPLIKTLWRRVGGEWLGISNDLDIKKSLENANISPVNNIETNEGFMYK